MDYGLRTMDWVWHTDWWIDLLTIWVRLNFQGFFVFFGIKEKLFKFETIIKII